MGARAHWQSVPPIDAAAPARSSASDARPHGVLRSRGLQFAESKARHNHETLTILDHAGHKRSVGRPFRKLAGSGERFGRLDQHQRESLCGVQVLGERRDVEGAEG